jgi:hypothetical protein
MTLRRLEHKTRPRAPCGNPHPDAARNLFPARPPVNGRPPSKSPTFDDTRLPNRPIHAIVRPSRRAGLAQLVERLICNQ